MVPLPLHDLISNRGFDSYQDDLKAQCQALGFKYQLFYCQPTPNPAMFFDLDSETHLGRATFWESGACDLEVLRIADGEQVLMQHIEFESEEKFDSGLSSLVAQLIEALNGANAN